MSKPIYIELDKAIAMMNLTFARPERITRFLELVPVADVAPVVHAHWEYVKSTDHEWDYPWMCSECGSCSQWETDYCKDCGAKMDEKETEHE